ncbi:MAG: PP0621 family protein [Giesbergeria sp.]
MKLLVLLVVLGVAYLVWRAKRVNSKKPAQPPGKLPAPQDMVACAHCGVHVPRSDAWLRDGRSYCSAEHLKHNAH